MLRQRCIRGVKDLRTLWWNFHRSAASVQHIATAGGLRTFSSPASSGPTPRGVEEVYTKKTPIEHVLLRPGMYIGSVSAAHRRTWLLDDAGAIVAREVEYVPGLCKLFDEILVNAVDNKRRDPNTSRIDVEIFPGSKTKPPVLRVTNDGDPIPVVFHKKEKAYVPELVMGHLLTGSNFDDSVGSVTGGRHGYGAKLANIFSTNFRIEVKDKKRGKVYKQNWSRNMHEMSEPEVTDAADLSHSSTSVEFSPDMARFGHGQATMDEGTYQYLLRRVYDVAGTTPEVAVSLNGKPVEVANFEEYAKRFLTQQEEENEEQGDAEAPEAAANMYYEKVNKRWEVAAAVAPHQGFQHVSFVNGIFTSEGGTHVAHVGDAIAKKVMEALKKRNPSLNITAASVRQHLMLFLNCLIENPSFSSQAKEQLVTPPSQFGSSCRITAAFVDRLLSTTNLEEVVVESLRSKESRELTRQLKRSSKDSMVRRIPKLEDANDAGGRKSHECTLILTEGDSAKALAVAGLSVVGRDKYGVFPLRGKLLNVRDLSPKAALKNEEISNLIAILGLDFTKTYKNTKPQQRGLRYGSVMIMTDQDHDGAHIKGLLLNFFDTFWPHLLENDGFLEEFITPVVKARKGKEELEFYSVAAYQDWLRQGDGRKGWKVKYYKGLGTSTAAEGRQYFSHIDKHHRRFQYEGKTDVSSLVKAFSKHTVGDRKQWLLAAPDVHGFYRGITALGSSDPPVIEDAPARDSTLKPTITYSKFVDSDLLDFSIADLSRSIPCVLDGLKPSQRKVLYACFKRGTQGEVKVSQLAGYCAEHTAYHHGEASLVSTIVGMAQDYVGSNNVPLLEPLGQFGTRLAGGKDAASARYIFTRLSPLARLLFPEVDDVLLPRRSDDGQLVEPIAYVPILPLVLLNGTNGIGTGWSTHVPSFQPQAVASCVLRHMGRDAAAQALTPTPAPMTPWFNGFTGSIAMTDSNYATHGIAEFVRGSSTKVRVKELPIGRWTDDYKQTLAKLLDSKVLTSVRENHTTTTVDFLLTLSKEVAEEIEEKAINNGDSMQAALMQLLRLKSTGSLQNMHLFSSEGRIRRYTTAEDVVADFVPTRQRLYSARRAHVLHQLNHDLGMMRHKIAFLEGVVHGNIDIGRLRREALVARLQELGFPLVFKSEEEGSGPSEGSDIKTALKGYSYLLNIPIANLSEDALVESSTKAGKLEEDLKQYEKTTVEDLWESEIMSFLDAFEKRRERHE